MAHTVIIDYDSGNLHSAHKAFEKMAREHDAGSVAIADTPEAIMSADRLVLPGDGAFPACKAALMAKSGFFDALREKVEDKATPFLGICVGMQLMARQGHEYHRTAGLNWIAGDVVPITPDQRDLKIPHMGWNTLNICQDHPVLGNVEQQAHVYFVHSFHMCLSVPEQLVADTDYGARVTAIVARDNMIGLQFHPEKSHKIGLRMIANFLTWLP